MTILLRLSRLSRCAILLPGVLLCTAALARGEEAPPSVFPYPVRETKLDNGLTIMTVPFDSPGTMSYYTIVRTGSRNEVEPGLSGFAHFFEHMMFRGTPQFSTEKYNAELKRFGADSNAFTGDDLTVYHITASAGALEAVIQLEADRFQNLAYDEAAFQKEARAVLGEYNKIASSPMLLLDEKMQDTAFTRHTYKHTTIGFLKDIIDMPNQYKYSRTFFERWYRPDNCIVVVVGDVRHGHVVQLAKRHYGNWKKGAAQIEIPEEPPQEAERRTDLTWKGVTLPQLYIGYHVPAFDAANRDVLAIDLLSEALFSNVSPLYRRLVLEEAKVEGIMAGAIFHRDPTLFTILLRLRSPDDLAYVERLIYEELERAGRELLPAQRLSDIKNHLRYQFRIDSTDTVALALANWLKLTGRWESLNETYAGYEQTTAKDVQRAAKTYFKKTNRTVVTLVSEGTPPAKAERAARAPAATPQTLAGRVAAKVQTVAERPAKDSRSYDRPSAGGLSGGQPPRDRAAGRRSAAGRSRAVQTAEKRSAGARQPGASKLSIVHVPVRSTTVAMRMMFSVGSQNDPPGKEGLAELTARVVAEGGSKRLTYQQLLEELFPLAAGVDAQCSKETTVFLGNVHREKFAEFYELFADVLVSPRFDEADFERLRTEQINSLAAGLRGNDDENLGKWTLQLALYDREHPYGHVDTGTVAGLKAITLDDVRSFYRKHYTAQNLRAGLSGEIDAQLLEQMQTDLAAKLPQGSAEKVALPSPTMPRDVEITIVEKPSIATAISIGFPIQVNRSDDDFYPLYVANSALGEHRTFNGRLMVNMRGKRGLNYGDYSYSENFEQEGDGASRFAAANIPRRQQYFSIWIRPVPHDKAVFALRQALRELDMFVSRGLDQQEFEAARDFLFHYSKLWVQTPSRRIGYKLDGVFYGRDDLVEELARRLPQMTLEQVNAAIRKQLQSRNVAVAVVTEKAKEFRDAVLSGKPTPLVYDTEGTPSEVLAEDKEIASWPLAVNREKLRIVPVAEMFER